MIDAQQPNEASETEDTLQTEPALSQESWHAAIDDPALRQAAERFATPTELVQAHGALRRKLSNAILPPGEDASDADFAEFRAKLGVPETPNDYGAALPDDLPKRLREDSAAEANLGAFVGAMHEAGAPKPVVDAALGWYWDTVKQLDGAATRAQTEAAQEAEAALRKEWGTAFGRNKSLAERALENFLGEDAESFRKLALKDGRLLGSHPVVIKALARIGREVSEGGLQVGRGDAAGGDALRARIKAIRALQDSDPQRYLQDATQRELTQLYANLYDTPSA